jgi:hypothetical protein
MDHPQKSQALVDIRAHLQESGSKNWGALRTRLDFVGPATFWRWVRETKARIAPELLGGSARRRSGEARLDFLGAYYALWADAVKLRTHSLHNNGNVRDPGLLDRSIRVRLKLLRQGLELEARIFSAGAQRAFYEALISEVATESPALHKRLASRLRRFSSEFDVERSEDPPEVEARKL